MIALVGQVSSRWDRFLLALQKIWFQQLKEDPFIEVFFVIKIDLKSCLMLGAGETSDFSRHNKKWGAREERRITLSYKSIAIKFFWGTFNSCRDKKSTFKFCSLYQAVLMKSRPCRTVLKDVTSCSTTKREESLALLKNTSWAVLHWPLLHLKHFWEPSCCCFLEGISNLCPFLSEEQALKSASEHFPVSAWCFSWVLTEIRHKLSVYFIVVILGWADWSCFFAKLSSIVTNQILLNSFFCYKGGWAL